MAEVEAGDAASESAEATPAVSATKVAPPRSSAAKAPPPGRPSMTAAFRDSFRPIDLRGDLRALPHLVTHWSFLVGVAITAAGAFAIPVLGSNTGSITLYQYFSGPEPIGTAFLVGFFAARGSYLLGGIIAVISVVFQTVAIALGGYDAAAASAVPPVTRDYILGQIPYQLVVSIPTSAFFASAAAWYRRFLRKANPNRQAPPPSGGRRPDGKVAKQQGRPMLARRR
jgi:hypothetical protein